MFPFFSQVSAVWPLYISSTILCVISCSFLHCLPSLLPNPSIFCSHQQYLLFNHCLHRGAVLELLSEQTSAGFAASFSPLHFSICHHPATTGQSLLVHLVIYVSLSFITTFSSQQMHLILSSASRAVWAEWVQGPGAGRTLPMLLEREKWQHWHQRWSLEPWNYEIHISYSFSIGRIFIIRNMISVSLGSVMFSCRDNFYVEGV